MVKYIDKIGLELEGGWATPPFKAVTDHSVKINHQCGSFERQNCHTCGCLDHYGYVPVNGKWWQGETNSPALTLDKVAEWLKKNYPDVSNESCGMHIHLSFKSTGHYLKLMDIKFNNYFIDYMDKKAKNSPIGSSAFWKRFKGENKFASPKFHPEKQVQVTGKGGTDRYTHLNYCWSMHGTLECRLFPMYSSIEVAGEAIKAFIDCVESYLDTVGDFVIQEEFEETVSVDFPICI